MSFVVIGGGIIASIAWRCYKCSHTKSVNEIRNTQKVLPTDTAPPVRFICGKFFIKIFIKLL